MPPGNLIEPQLDRNAIPPRPLLPLLAAAIAFGLALLSLVHFQSALVAFVSRAGSAPLSVWLRPTLYGIYGLLFCLFLRAIFGLMDTAIRNRTDKTAPKSVDQFIEQAGRLHITPNIAREAFQILDSLEPARTAVDLHDDLRTQLSLSDQQIGSLLVALSERCNRSQNPLDIASIHSVYDLLHHVESAPVAHPESCHPSGLPAPPPYTAPTSPLAGLQTASPRDSRFRTRAHFSGMKRRASDYSGPYRRATDRIPDTNYTGPRRRVSDLQPAEGQAANSLESGQRDLDRRILDRRSDYKPSGSPPNAPDAASEGRQHKAANASLLNSRTEQPRPQAPTAIEVAILAAPSTREPGSLPDASLRN